MTDETAELKAQISALQQRMEELERKAKPSAPFVSDYVPPSPNRHLDRLSMPPSAMADMVAAVPDRMVADIVRDLRSIGTLSPAVSNAGAPKLRGTGWRDATPLGPPPGVAQADKLMDAADKADRVELAQRLAKLELARRAAKKEPNAA